MAKSILTGAEILVNMLENLDVEVVFGYPGSSIAPIYNILSKSKIKHILTRHEQAAANAASGYARVTGKVGICIATAGPGVTNLTTGIASAYMDSIPIIAITGQVERHKITRYKYNRIDVHNCFKDICKKIYEVKEVTDINKMMIQAFKNALSGRSGPVLIDIPLDILNSRTYYEDNHQTWISKKKRISKSLLKQVINLINYSSKPVICAGGGVVLSNAKNELVQLIDKVRIPVVTTLMGIGTVPSNHPLHLGLLGFHGSPLAYETVNQSDLLILLGMRATPRTIGPVNKFATKAKIIRVDIDQSEIKVNLHIDIEVVSDIKEFLNKLIKNIDISFKNDWINIIRSQKKFKINTKMNKYKSNFVDPKFFFRVLSEATNGNVIIASGVGQSQIWAANYFNFKNNSRYITSGGLGAMGYGLPASIGGKIGAPDKIIVAIEGDGSFQMTMQELGTIQQNNLKILIVIFNNMSLGLIRELQKDSYKSNFYGVSLQGSPDYVKLASSYGIKAKRVCNNYILKGVINDALRHQGAFLLELIVDPCEKSRET